MDTTETSSFHSGMEEPLPSALPLHSPPGSRHPDVARNQSFQQSAMYNNSGRCQMDSQTHLSGINQTDNLNYDSVTEREIYPDDFDRSESYTSIESVNSSLPVQSHSTPSVNYVKSRTPQNLRQRYHTSQGRPHSFSWSQDPNVQQLREPVVANVEDDCSPLRPVTPLYSEGIPKQQKTTEIKESGSQDEKSKMKKEKKSITTKTFAHGMMDVSLLTSNATQLRSVLSDEAHPFYTILLWFIGVSIALQILSSILMIVSDFYKTQDTEKDRLNQSRRKLLNFIALALISVITALNILISAFYFPSPVQAVQHTNKPVFSNAGFAQGQARSEL